MAKIRKQIISPHVRFGASSRGPYANKLGGGLYAKSFGLREAVASFIAFGETSAGVIKALVKGDSPVTFTGSAGRTVITQPDGLTENVLENEIRFQNGNRQRNFIGTGANVTNPKSQVSTRILDVGGSKATAQNAVKDGRKCIEITLESGASGYGETGSIANNLRSRWNSSGNEKGILSSWVQLARELTAGEIIWFYDTAIGTQLLERVVIDSSNSAQFVGSWVRVSGIEAAATTDENNSSPWYFWLGGGTTTSELTYWLADVQIDDAFSKSSVAPTDYTSVGIGTGINLNTSSNGGSAEIAGEAEWINEHYEGEFINPTTSRVLTGYFENSLVLNKRYEIILRVYDLSVGRILFNTTGPESAFAGINIAFNANGTYSYAFVCDDVSANRGVSISCDANTTGKFLIESLKECDHGAFVDSVQYSAETNGWEVSNFIATRTATITPLTDYRALFEPTVDDGAGMFNFSNFDITQGAFILDITMAAASNQGIINFANAQAGILSYDTTNQFRTTDGTNQVTVDPSLSANLGDIIRFAILYSADNGLRLGYKNITDAGSWVWGTPASFSGAYASNSVFNVFFGIATASTIRDLLYYKADIGEERVESDH